LYTYNREYATIKTDKERTFCMSVGVYIRFKQEDKKLTIGLK